MNPTISSLDGRAQTGSRAHGAAGRHRQAEALPKHCSDFAKRQLQLFAEYDGERHGSRTEVGRGADGTDVYSGCRPAVAFTPQMLILARQ